MQRLVSRFRAPGTRASAWLLASLLGACSQSTGAGSGPLRRPANKYEDTPERTTGCIDTPYVGGDAGAAGSGIVCGRARSPSATLLRGRVSLQVEGALPGAGAEGMLVSLHLLGAGPLNLDALPPAHAQATTGPQGAFTLSLPRPEAAVIVVRATADGPILAARQLDAQHGREPINLLVPAP